MKLEKLKFNDSVAQRIYNDYMKRLEKSSKSLSKSEQEDIMLEFNSHIYEATRGEKSNLNANELNDVLGKLGAPEDVLKPLIADKKLELATRTFNPIHVFKALVLNITNGVSYIIFFLLYLFLFSFIYLVIAKLIWPSEVGMFFADGEFAVLGHVNANSINDPIYVEVLGCWFIPVMLLSGLIFYFLITLLLKLKRVINKK